MPDFLRRHPEVRIALELSERLSSLAQEGFDLAIRQAATVPETHVAWLLCETRPLLVASLAYLQQFRFDKLKIDRAFVAPLGLDPSSQAMIQAIVTLGRALGLTLLAEGVETEEQRVMLRLAGCDEMQGFLFATPGPCKTVDRLLEQAGSAVG